MNIIEITLKLLLAVALGGLIGYEREASQKPAGFRTNILICIGATMMMTLSGIVLPDSGDSSREMMRMAAGVITGIGFIGAGTIIQAQGMVLGLTTAASLWAVAGLGLVIGAGYYVISLIYTLIIILTLAIFRRFEDAHLQKSLYRYTLKTRYTKDTLPNVKKLALHEGIRFRAFSHKREGNYAIISFSFQASEEKEKKFNGSLTNLKEIREISIE